MEEETVVAIVSTFLGTGFLIWAYARWQEYSPRPKYKKGDKLIHLDEFGEPLHGVYLTIVAVSKKNYKYDVFDLKTKKLSSYGRGTDVSPIADINQWVKYESYLKTLDLRGILTEGDK